MCSLCSACAVCSACACMFALLRPPGQPGLAPPRSPDEPGQASPQAPSSRSSQPPPGLGPAPQLSGEGAPRGGAGRGREALGPGGALGGGSLQSWVWGGDRIERGWCPRWGSPLPFVPPGAPPFPHSLSPQAWLALLTSVRLSVWPAGQSLLGAGLRDGHLIWPPGPSGSTTDQWEVSQPRGGRAQRRSRPLSGLPGCPPARQALSRLGPVSGLRELQPPWARPGCVGGRGHGGVRRCGLGSGLRPRLADHGVPGRRLTCSHGNARCLLRASPVETRGGHA